MNLVGIDGCRGGWALAVGDASLRCLAFAIRPDFHSVLRDWPVGVEPGGALIAIDVPVGLWDAGDRACDKAARKYLGPAHSSSVFPAPCPATLAATCYREACEINCEACGKRVSAQLHGILRKIRDVNQAMTPSLQNCVREAHPEVTFAALSGTGHGLPHPKKCPEGEQERLALLHRFLPRFDPGRERAGLGPRNVGRDDLIDAAACLVTAHRISRAEAVVFPAGDMPLNARGLRMEIVA